jgi:hypothetical protein
MAKKKAKAAQALEKAIDQIAVSIRKRMAERPSQNKKMRDFDLDIALELYEHLINDVIEDDYPELVFDRLLLTLFIAREAMTNRMTLEQVRATVKATRAGS